MFRRIYHRQTQLFRNQSLKIKKAEKSIEAKISPYGDQAYNHSSSNCVQINFQNGHATLMVTYVCMYIHCHIFQTATACSAALEYISVLNLNIKLLSSPVHQKQRR